MSDDTKALVKRLRESLSPGCYEAADAIERLDGAVAYWRDATEHTLDRATESLRESRTALAERCEKLREALRELLDALDADRAPIADDELDSEVLMRLDNRLAAAQKAGRTILAAPKDAP